MNTSFDAFFDALSALHFLRPAWLLLLPIIVVFWWWWRRHQQAGTGQTPHIAAHLEKAMRIGTQQRRWITPVDTLSLMLILLVTGAAGPSWSRMPNPLIAQTAPLVVVVEVDQGMLAQDVPPNRLERAKHKISDLLATRSGADTALVAYSGSAHLVVPLTNDPELIKPYLEGLTPDVMPQAGDGAASDALTLAQEQLAKREEPGAILFVTDGLSTTDRDAFSQQDDTTLAFLVMAPGNVATPVIDAVDAERVAVSADERDIQHLERLLAAAHRRALLNDDRLAWEDRGMWLAWPAALLALLWFRRGWGLGTSSLLACFLLLPWPATVPQAMAQNQVTIRAQDSDESHGSFKQWLADAFLTPDQQGRWWVEHRSYKRAAEHFQDPNWQGYALYRDGQYDAAAELLGRLDSADAAFTQGLALIRGHQYRPAVQAFEKVLSIDPDYPQGERNLELAKRILTYVEESREQSDTGQDDADDVTFDNEENRGQDTQVTPKDGEGMLTAEQWISTLNSNTSDYLRQRFAVEARQGATP
uniref:VWA domain-containing protein n=1 Tax=Halomonas sp. TaxID=1486246 RepID=UPI002617B1A8|nr:VWA domain-containing protein [Halomonas sp.]